jgi:hypothetical protein
VPRAWVSVSATLYMCIYIGICTVHVYVDVTVYVFVYVDLRGDSHQ